LFTQLVDPFLRRWGLNAVLAVALMVLLSAWGCGGTKGQGDGGDVGKIVAVNGRISTRGSTPFSVVMLEAADQKTYIIEQSPLADELRSLDGMEVFVRASVITRPEDQGPTLDVISYDLRALPSGDIPIVGYIRPGGFLEDDSMIIWKLDGDFAEILRTFVGAKVWVVGVDQPNVDTPDGTTYRVILVTEYGVIGR
jgi:hypothetical protein